MPDQAHALRRTPRLTQVGALAFSLGGLAGCRFGFDDVPRVDSSVTVDAPDAIPAGHCGATKIANYDLGVTGMVDVAAAQVADGFAIGTTTSDSILFGVHLDRQLVPNASTPFQTTPATGLPGHYSNGSLYFDGTNLVGGLTVTDGTSYLKVLLSDMTSFGNYIQRTGRIGEPSIGTANGTVAVSTWFHDTEIDFVSLLVDGTPDTTDRVFTLNEPANVRSVTIASGPSVVVAWDLVNNGCGLGAISDTFGTTTGTLAGTACAKPYVHGNHVIYENLADLVVDDLSVTNLPTVSVTDVRTLVQGSDPRLLTIAGQEWFAWRDNSRVHLSPIESVTDVPIDNLPSGLPDAYEPAGPYLFAVWGSELWAVTCP